jgi:hypothetical protein
MNFCWSIVYFALPSRERVRVNSHVHPHLNPLPPKEGEEVILRSAEHHRKKIVGLESVLTQRRLAQIIGMAADCCDEILKHRAPVDQAGIHLDPFPARFTFDDEKT